MSTDDAIVVVPDGMLLDASRELDRAAAAWAKRSIAERVERLEVTEDRLEQLPEPVDALDDFATGSSEKQRKWPVID